MHVIRPTSVNVLKITMLNWCSYAMTGSFRIARLARITEVANHNESGQNEATDR